MVAYVYPMPWQDLWINPVMFADPAYPETIPLDCTFSTGGLSTGRARLNCDQSGLTLCLEDDGGAWASGDGTCRGNNPNLFLYAVW